MLSAILVIGVLISVNDAYLPAGNFAGRVPSPYLSVDCTFVPGSGVSSVHMVVGCDETKPAAVGRFQIKPLAHQPGKYVITDFKTPNYMRMMAELRSLCPGRGFLMDDFASFERIKGKVILHDDYRVYYDRNERSVLLTRLTNISASVQGGRA
ncbi:hypothetical protein FOZ61_005747 [Perkinsus olseni]|uniref:Uncharacterized protein n=1 Tax=Perkinsus olseni TaxID=32597 RepID=A0A7J6LTI7_PEROL|nr:hypothetical protein FOZ61_005747 [Perkinsus olseni]KAF4662456.1 hypothetical protein FOL46_005276 [Perkinsus olseni]